MWPRAVACRGLVVASPRLVICFGLAVAVAFGVLPGALRPGEVEGAPVANFQASTGRGEAPLTVQFTDTSNGGQGQLSYEWDFGDGGTSTVQNPSHTYLVPRGEGYKVTLVVRDAAGPSPLKSDVVVVDGPTLVAALLPVSRSVPIGSPATAFLTVINAGRITATAVNIELDPTTGPGGGPLPGALSFQTTNPATNALTGAPNVAVDIEAGKSQSYLVTVTPTSPLPPTDVRLDIGGTNTTRDARTVPGLNTLLLSASAAATPDVIAVAVTPDANGILALPGQAAAGAFAVATANVGAGGIITALADTGGVALPLALLLCRTEPATGACLAPPSPTVEEVQMDSGATASFAVFAQATGAVPYDPESRRIFVRFTDAGGATRGATSVAVKTP